MNYFIYGWIIVGFLCWLKAILKDGYLTGAHFVSLIFMVMIAPLALATILIESRFMDVVLFDWRKQ